MTGVAVDGQVVPCDGRWVCPTDPGFLFGLGVFTTCQLNDGELVNFAAHVARLQEQCAQLNIPFKSPSLPTIASLVRQQKAESGEWRLKMILTPKHEMLYLERLSPQSAPIRLNVFPSPFQNPLLRFKSTAYLDRILVKRFAEREGYEDAITLSPDGCCLETAFANLFWIQGESFFYPDESLEYYFGTTLGAVREVAAGWGYSIRGLKIAPQNLPAAARLYRCNALVGIQPVHRVLQQVYPLRPGEQAKLTRALQARWKPNSVIL